MYRLPIVEQRDANTTTSTRPEKEGRASPPSRLDISNGPQERLGGGAKRTQKLTSGCSEPVRPIAFRVVIVEKLCTVLLFSGIVCHWLANCQHTFQLLLAEVCPYSKSTSVTIRTIIVRIRLIYCRGFPPPRRRKRGCEVRNAVTAVVNSAPGDL